jgi:hypothetical protein
MEEELPPAALPRGLSGFIFLFFHFYFFIVPTWKQTNTIFHADTPRMPHRRSPLPELPNLTLDYAHASTPTLLRELELLEFYLNRYPHMLRARAWRELARRNTAVAAGVGWGD